MDVPDILISILRQQINPLLRGWGNNYRHVVSKAIFKHIVLNTPPRQSIRFASPNLGAILAGGIFAQDAGNGLMKNRPSRLAVR